MDFLQQILAVFLVLASLAVLVCFGRARGFLSLALLGARRGPRRMQPIERLLLTPQHSMHLVRVEDRVLLLGLSPGGVQLLESRPAGPDVDARTEAR